MKTKEVAYKEYTEKLEKWQARGIAVPDLRPVTSQDVMLVMMSLHRCQNKRFMQVTTDLMLWMEDKDVITSDEVLQAGVCTLPAFYRRMQVLRKANMIRFESRRYYIITPRMKEFITHYKRLMRNTKRK